MPAPVHADAIEPTDKLHALSGIAIAPLAKSGANGKLGY